MNADAGATLGRRLKVERARIRLTQAQLAAHGGVSKATQVAYELDRTTPDAAYLSAISDAGVDVMRVLTGRPARNHRLGEVVFALLETLEEWAVARPASTKPAGRNDLSRILYASSRDGQIDEDVLCATVRLAGQSPAANA